MANFWTTAVLFACLLAVSNGGANSWWSLGVTNCAVSDTCSNCDELRGANILTDTQVATCSDDSQSVHAIAAGIRSAIIQCHEQFKHRKWTCAALSDSTNLFGAFINEKRTKETAVLYAFLVAGATQKLAQFCQEGKISNDECQCSQAGQRKVNETLIFDKCGENVDWAQRYIEAFTKSPYQDLPVNDTGALIDIHNIEVGKKAMSKTYQFCKCHGISGTCSVQTCYEKLPDISEVSESLYFKYGGAVKVVQSDGELKRDRTINANADEIENTDLAYYDNTPDLCKNATEEGVQGTAHRECLLDQGAVGSCESLCCGNGHYAVTETKIEKDCAFHYCCEFRCTEREVTTTTYRCKPDPNL